ncbi:hypothetical protein ABK040_006227 [Willaertia magna]
MELDSMLFLTSEEFSEKILSVGGNNETISTLLNKKQEVENFLNKVTDKYQKKVAKYNQSEKARELYEKYVKKTTEVAERLFGDYVKCVAKNTSVDPSETLNKWFLEHMNYPFPSSTEKKFICQISGLTEKQITNWFINNRGRSWKKIVESDKNKIYEVDFGQGKVSSEE